MSERSVTEDYDKFIRREVFYLPWCNDILIAEVDCSENELAVLSFHLGLAIANYDLGEVEHLGEL